MILKKLTVLSPLLSACLLRGGSCGLILLILTLWITPLPVLAQPLRPLLQQLAQTHPALVSQYEQVLASEATVDEAKSGYLPRVNVGVNYGYEERDRSGGISSNGETESKPLDTSVSITQNVFEGFRTQSSVQAAQTSTRVASVQLTVARQQVFLQAIQSYIQLLQQWHLLQLSRQNISGLAHQVNLEQERVSVGTGIAVDVLLAKSRLQRAHERYANFLGQFHQAEAGFQQFFGVKPNYQTLRLPTVIPTSLPQQLPQAEQVALMNHPALLQAELEAEATHSEKDIARAGYFPRLDVVASSSFTDSGDTISGETTSNALQLRGSWELFSGFADQNREKRAVHSYQSALASAQDTRRRIIENTQRAWAQLVSSRQRAAILQGAASTAGEVYTARQRLRDIGSETAINVLDAENEMFQAQISAVQARYESYQAVYQLLQSVGTLEASIIY